MEVARAYSVRKGINLNDAFRRIGASEAVALAKAKQDSQEKRDNLVS